MYILILILNIIYIYIYIIYYANIYTQTYHCNLKNMLKNIHGKKMNQNVHSDCVKVEDYTLLSLFLFYSSEVSVIHFVFNLF